MAGFTGPYGGDGVVGRRISFWAMGRGVRGLRRWVDDVSAWGVILSKVVQTKAKNIFAIYANVIGVDWSLAKSQTEIRDYSKFGDCCWIGEVAFHATLARKQIWEFRICQISKNSQ